MFKKNRLFIMSLLMTLVLFAVVHADTHTAASCSQAHVQAAVNSAANGDTVVIPNGSCSWTDGISTTRQIRIEAQYYTPTAGGNTSRSVIITNNSPDPLFTLTSGSSYHCGIAGIKFVEGTQKTNFIRIQGNGTRVPLIHDCWFDIDERFGNQPDIAVFAVLSLGGVVWNCRFDTPGSDFQGYPGSQGASMYINSPRDWYTASTMGALDTNGTVNIYFEDCTFFNCSQCPDIDDNGRAVFRHCLLDGSGGITHGFTSISGGRHFEYYDNTFTVTTPERNQSRYFWCRGGTGIFTDNVVNNNVTPSAFGSQTLLDIGDNTNPTSMGSYPIARQPGWGHNGTSNVSDPIYIWKNTGSRAYIWSHNTQAGPWDQYVQLDRDLFVNSGAKPGYQKYAYPHPLRSSGSGIRTALTPKSPVDGPAEYEVYDVKGREILAFRGQCDIQTGIANFMTRNRRLPAGPYVGVVSRGSLRPALTRMVLR